LSAFLQQETTQSVDLDTAVHALTRMLGDDATPGADTVAPA
jgi:hypothetical protein